MRPLWTSDEIARATGGTASGPFEVTGVTFDSREVGPGDLFVAMPGTVHDGHEFVDAAFAAGAAGAIVSLPAGGPHVLVEDVFAALQALGRASRERSRATIVGVTGSVGKTSTKKRSMPRSTAAGRARSTARSRAITIIPACRCRSRECRARPTMPCSKWA